MENISLSLVADEYGDLVSLTDAERTIGLMLPDALDANTLSDLSMAALGDMPDIGDEVIEYGYRFTIKNIENHRVGTLIIEKLEPVDAQPLDTELSSSHQQQ